MYSPSGFFFTAKSNTDPTFLNNILFRYKLENPADYPQLVDFKGKLNSRYNCRFTQFSLRTFPWFSRVPQSKFEANRSNLGEKLDVNSTFWIPLLPSQGENLDFKTPLKLDFNSTFELHGHQLGEIWLRKLNLNSTFWIPVFTKSPTGWKMDA